MDITSNHGAKRSVFWVLAESTLTYHAYVVHYGLTTFNLFGVIRSTCDSSENTISKKPLLLQIAAEFIEHHMNYRLGVLNKTTIAFERFENINFNAF